MNVDHCEFPDNLYYDVENDVWFQPANDDSGKMGISSVFVFLAGKISSIKFRPVLGLNLNRGQSIATIESIRHVGAVRSPIVGKISRLNEALVSEPQHIWKSPYQSWIAEYESFDRSSLDTLQRGTQARDQLLQRIQDLRIHCFKLLPDDDMYSIGTECTTTLANLSELLDEKQVGYVVHLVTDDPTADIELVRWSMQTGNELVESRRENTLYHFIIRKSGEKT